ncbi:MAG: RNA polymerase factor sigma-54, partial [Muribaculaceae bacterium]|nr:RNA polymerase factor sigma-54 [Muribaculaceae bacterium]
IIADYIIGNIDNNGYLTRDLNLIINDLSLQEGLEISRAEAQEVFDAIRRLDPPGIGAIDLRDCLLLQLNRHPMSGTSTVADDTEIVADYFDLFSKRHFDRLCSAMSMTRERLQQATEIITSLNPKPGGAISAESSDRPVHTVIPDFTVDTDGDTITVSLSNSIPELRIERSFTVTDDEIKESAADRSNSMAGAFIKQKRDSAASFIRMLQMRQETLFKVMKAIVGIQRAFFLNGDDESRIRPMILKDISTITGIDLSVISRATMGKWVATPHGVYPLKMFFNERVRDNDDTSSHEILAAIRQIIDTEDKRHPLSDNIITERLGEMGYELARRTVAKYRERLGLP